MSGRHPPPDASTGAIEGSLKLPNTIKYSEEDTMKKGINLGLHIKRSAFLTAPIVCAVATGLLLAAPQQALAWGELHFDHTNTRSGQITRDYGSIFSGIQASVDLDQDEWKSGTPMKNLLENQNFNDHSDNGKARWGHENGFMKNKHENAILFGNHLEGLLRQTNDRHDEKHHNNVVPIPASAWLFGSAIGLLGWSKRRKA
jgi:hypothetical protein